MKDHLWGIVVAGGAGEHRRPRHLRQPAHRSARPGRVPRHALFQQALDRAAQLVPQERLLAVLAREHGLSHAGVQGYLPGVRRVVQPAYRGSAPEVFLPALRIALQDPHATVVVFPGDHAVEGEARLMSQVTRAARAVAVRPDLVVVIGVHPPAPDPDAGWIEPGDPVEGLETFAVRSVRRFLPRPTPDEMVALDRADGLVNTRVVIARVAALLDLGRRAAPDVLESLEPLEHAFDAPEEALLFEAVWEQMPHANLASVLCTRPQQTAVLAVPDVRVYSRPAPVYIPQTLAS